MAGVAGWGCRALLPKHRQAEWQTLARIQGSEAWEGLVAGEGAGRGHREHKGGTTKKQLNALIWSSKPEHPPSSCKMEANRYDGSRPTVREQDHLKTPPSLLHVKCMYLRGLCENTPRSRAESHLGWAAAVVRPFGILDVLNFLSAESAATARCANPWMASRWSQTQTMAFY